MELKVIGHIIFYFLYSSFALRSRFHWILERAFAKKAFTQKLFRSLVTTRQQNNSVWPSFLLDHVRSQALWNPEILRFVCK
jgi:hypothetical protein